MFLESIRNFFIVATLFSSSVSFADVGTPFNFITGDWDAGSSSVTLLRVYRQNSNSVVVLECDPGRYWPQKKCTYVGVEVLSFDHYTSWFNSPQLNIKLDNYDNNKLYSASNGRVNYELSRVSGPFGFSCDSSDDFQRKNIAGDWEAGANITVLRIQTVNVNQIRVRECDPRAYRGRTGPCQVISEQNLHYDWSDQKFVSDTISVQVSCDNRNRLLAERGD